MELHEQAMISLLPEWSQSALQEDEDVNLIYISSAISDNTIHDPSRNVPFQEVDSSIEGQLHLLQGKQCW